MELSQLHSNWSLPRELPALLISGVGAILVAIVSWHLMATHLQVMMAETDPTRLVLESVEAILLIVPPILIVYFGFWTSNRDIPRECLWRVLQWILAGLIGVVGVITALTIHRMLLGYPLRTSLVEMELLTGAGIGSLLGFAVGKHRASSELRAQTIKDQRDAFLFLNHLLRHHVLNSIQLIDGYSAQLKNYDDPTLRQVHEIVRTRSQEITSLIQNIQTIVSTFTDSPQRERVNLTAVVECECHKALQVHETAEIETDLPEAVYIQSNELLAVVIRNLIENAIQHTDQALPRVQVAVEDCDQTARVCISDNGPGISPDDADQFLNPGETGDRGTGLYLANRVISQQGGQLLIEDNTPRGTVVTVELPKPTAHIRNQGNESQSTNNQDTDPTY